MLSSWTSFIEHSFANISYFYLSGFLIRKRHTQILNGCISFIYTSICIFFEVIDHFFNSTFITISLMSLDQVIERESLDVSRALRVVEVIRTEEAGQDVSPLWSLSTGPPQLPRGKATVFPKWKHPLLPSSSQFTFPIMLTCSYEPMRKPQTVSWVHTFILD